jgi:simple sugar transport system permease protein
VNLILDFAPPLVFAALGGVLSERAGVVNIGLEGMMRFGAFASAAGAIFSGSPWVGFACGALAGACAAAVHALLSLRFRADQVVSGIALNLVALGLVTYLVQAVFGSSGVSPPAPSLSRDRFGHSPLAYAALAVPLLFHLWLSWTPAGLRVRAVGEHPRAAAAMGVRVLWLRAACVLFSGVLAGAGGATLSVGIVGQFDSRMPAGQGFMALAAMVFGRWTPLGAAAASFFFAAAEALQRQLSFSLHAADLRLEGVFLALPYAFTLLVLAFRIGRTRAPAADGVPYDPETQV